VSCGPLVLFPPCFIIIESFSNIGRDGWISVFAIGSPSSMSSRLNANLKADHLPDDGTNHIWSVGLRKKTSTLR
jgi:hypothetical protein